MYLNSQAGGNDINIETALLRTMGHKDEMYFYSGTKAGIVFVPFYETAFSIPVAPHSDAAGTISIKRQWINESSGLGGEIE